MKRQLSVYRARAERAIGRRLKRSEHVHHHSHTQLVICSQAYHAWLHSEMRRLNIRTQKPLMFIIRDIPEDFWIKVKTKAASQNITVKAVIFELLKGWVK